MTAILRTPWGAISGGSLLAVAAGMALAISFGAWTVVLLLSAGVAGIAGALALHPRPEPETPARLIEKVTEQAASGRKLVIYERETGLFAHWYLALRCEEECHRATRYARSLSLLVIEPLSPDNAWGVKDDLANWISQNLRATDVAAYFGNGRYVVVMPEATPNGVERVLERMAGEVPGVALATSDFGVDGATYDELYAAASERLIAEAKQAA
jgi:hypothetical protein